MKIYKVISFILRNLSKKYEIYTNCYNRVLLLRRNNLTLYNDNILIKLISLYYI